MILIREIIDKYERMDWARWPELPSGGKSCRIHDANYHSGRREEILADVFLLLERGLITMKKGDWVEYMRDPAVVRYRLEDMSGFYELAGIKPKWERIAERTKELSLLGERIRTPWIRRYLRDEQEKLGRGSKCALSSEEESYARRKLYRCLVGLDEIACLAQENSEQVPMFHRVFSKRYLGHSKMFEKEMRSTVIALARHYHPTVSAERESMDDVDVLEQLHLEIYSQELTLKGELHLELTGPDGKKKRLNTADYPYGMTLNQKTLTHAEPCREQTLQRVRIIENKANFMAEPFEEGKLVVFSHGYLTPTERKFLIRLRKVLEGQSVRYEHSGDLDYGGICIYRYLREQVFPGLQPYRMDVETYESCLAAEMAEVISEEMAAKLKGLSCDPQLGALAARLAADRRVVEQEAYL